MKNLRCFQAALKNSFRKICNKSCYVVAQEVKPNKHPQIVTKDNQCFARKNFHDLLVVTDTRKVTAQHSVPGTKIAADYRRIIPVVTYLHATVVVAVVVNDCNA